MVFNALLSKLSYFDSLDEVHSKRYWKKLSLIDDLDPYVKYEMLEGGPTPGKGPSPLQFPSPPLTDCHPLCTSCSIVCRRYSSSQDLGHRSRLAIYNDAVGLHQNAVGLFVVEAHFLYKKLCTMDPLLLLLTIIIHLQNDDSHHIWNVLSVCVCLCVYVCV